MTKILLLILILLSVSCGKSGSNQSIPVPAPVTPVPNAPGATNHVSLIIASRSGNNGGATPGMLVAGQTSVVPVPIASDLVITQNLSEFYHVSVTLGTVVCDFIHNLNNNSMSNGGGCTTASSTVTLTAGQTILVDIGNNGQVNNTTVTLTTNLTY